MAMVELPSPTDPPLPPPPPLQWARSKRLRSSPSPLRRFPHLPPPSPPPPTSSSSEATHNDRKKRRKKPPPPPPPPPPPQPKPKPDAAEEEAGKAPAGGRRRRVPKRKVELWVSLSRDEIEEDYYSITGCKLPRRPRKRSRALAPTALDRVFPGSWLPNMVTVEMYKVHEPPEGRKR